MEILPGTGYKILIPVPDDLRDFFDLKEQLNKIIDQGSKNFIVNMKALPSIDSRGLGLLLQLHKDTLLAGGKMVMYGLSEPVVELINMCRLNSTFKIVNDESEARKAISG